MKYRHLYREMRVSPPERLSMCIPLDMNNTAKSKKKELSEDRKEMIRILLAFVVMAIIFWFMLISSSVPCNADRLLDLTRL
jgi:hypothetical protein